MSSKEKFDSDAVSLKLNLFLPSLRLVLKCFNAVFLESNVLQHPLLTLSRRLWQIREAVHHYSKLQKNKVFKTGPTCTCLF